ncbi:MAG: DUF2191 domain-containing protein [Puniceicoccaceae bacterium]
MRTTITLEADVEEKAKPAMQTTGVNFKTLINEALRCGIAEIKKPRESRAFKTESRPLGLKNGFNYDNLAELLAQTEQEDFR